MSGAPAGSHVVDADGADTQLLAISMTKGLDEETTKDLVVKATGGQSESVMDMLLERARFQPHQVTEPYRLMVDLCNHVSSIIHSPNCPKNSDVLDGLRRILTGICAQGTRHAAVVPCCLELAAKCLIVMEYWSNDCDVHDRCAAEIHWVFKKLFEHYDRYPCFYEEDGRKTVFRFTSEPKMRSLYLIWTGGGKAYDQSTILFKRRRRIYDLDEVQFAVKVSEVWIDEDLPNYARFFGIFRDVIEKEHTIPCPFTIFAMFRHFGKMRKHAIRGFCMSQRQEGDLYPMKRLVRLLSFVSTEEAAEYCRIFNIGIGGTKGAEYVKYFPSSMPENLDISSTLPRPKNDRLQEFSQRARKQLAEARLTLFLNATKVRDACEYVEKFKESPGAVDQVLVAVKRDLPEHYSTVMNNLDAFKVLVGFDAPPHAETTSSTKNSEFSIAKTRAFSFFDTSWAG